MNPINAIFAKTKEIFNPLKQVEPYHADIYNTSEMDI